MSRTRRFLLLAGAFAMIVIGIEHFRNPAPFVSIVPAFLPEPLLLVYVSGAFEIALGAGLLYPKSRRLSAWGLIALYVAVFPANINMALNEIQLSPDGTIPVWAMWLRLPIQGVFIAWAYLFASAEP